MQTTREYRTGLAAAVDAKFAAVRIIGDCLKLQDVKTVDVFLQLLRVQNYILNRPRESFIIEVK